jgi:hypothetical protein
MKVMGKNVFTYRQNYKKGGQKIGSQKAKRTRPMRNMPKMFSTAIFWIITPPAIFGQMTQRGIV